MTEIKAETINLLFERMNLILGNGSGQNGYGQGRGAGYGVDISSYPVSNNPGGNLPTIISASDINSLFTDMLRCRVHQVGTIAPEIFEIAQILTNFKFNEEDNTENPKWNIVGLNTSFFIDSTGVVTNDPDGTKKGISDYQNLMTQIESDKFLAHPSQMTLENAITSIRTEPWNGVNTHEFTVSFRNADHRRHFFNSGGEIRFSSSNSNSTNAKGIDWNSMLVGVGTVRFNYQTTQSTSGLGTASNIGNYQLTNTYQLLYRKIRSNSTIYSAPSSVYDGNQYTIEGRQINDSQIRFRIRYEDISDDINNRGRDENVTGRLESNIRIYRASSDVSVKVPAPDFANNIELSTAPVPAEPPPPPPPVNSCNVNQGVVGVGRGIYTYTLNLGSFTGTTGITYNAYATVPDNFTIVWNNQTVTTGLVTGTGTLTFNKTSATPETATLTVDADRNGTLFDWQIICPTIPPT